MTDPVIRRRTGKRMSQVVEVPAGATMPYFAGQISADRTLDLEGQTRDILAKVAVK